MAADEIARVVADLKAHRVINLLRKDRELFNDCLNVVSDPVIVDATALYRSLAEKETPYYLYEDHPCIAPPWEEAAVCYVNQHGNVIVMHTNIVPRGDDPPWTVTEDHVVDWDRVRWLLYTWVWVGGRGGGVAVETAGPMMSWQYAIYEDGQPADLHWMVLGDSRKDPDVWNMAQLVLLQTLNFMNCRNVSLVEPHRLRAERRRIAETGLKIQTISVTALAKAVRSLPGEPGDGVPLTSVRGHFAKYGEEFDRRLLFGKYSGRFWIAQYARGTAERGERRSDFRLVV